MSVYFSRIFGVSEVFTPDGRFRLFFKPLSSECGNGMEAGLYVQQTMSNQFGQYYWTICSVRQGDLDWHTAECRMLGEIDGLVGYPDADVEAITELVWNAIVDKTRERFENGE